MSAWLNAFCGFALVYGLGIFFLNMTFFEATWAIVATNLGGFCGLLLVSASGRKAWLRKNFMPNPFWTWLVFLLVYFGLTIGLAPPVWDFKRYAWLALPLMLCNGVSILIYGPIQDRLVARDQRAAG